MLAAIALLAVLAAPGPQTARASGWQGRAHVTSYCRLCDPAWNKGACGTNRPGYTVAASRKLPAGTRITLKGFPSKAADGAWLLTDRGGGDRLRSRGEDLWVDILHWPRCPQKCQWGKDNIRYRAVKPKRKPTQRGRR